MKVIPPTADLITSHVENLYASDDDDLKLVRRFVKLLNYYHPLLYSVKFDDLVCGSVY